MKHADYVPLHVHTEYSLLDGAIRINELVEVASQYRMPAVAITDHGNLFGTIEFYKAATRAGLKPIIGCEVYVAPEGRFQKRTTKKGENAFHLILLARDKDGYKNLVTLVSKAYTEGFYYKPRIDLDLLSQYSGGLIGLSSCMHGEIPYYLSQGLIDKARDSALKYKNILGPENFYLELQDNGIKEQYEINKMLLELSRELHIKVVATNDCHYLRKEDARAHDILLCIQTGKTINSEDRMRFDTDQLYFKSPEEMKRAFAEIPDAILNTREIAERCNLEFHLGVHKLPKFDIKEGLTPEEYLDSLARQGLNNRFSGNPPGAYLERLEYELKVIKKMGYAPYFLIVWDFINYAKTHGIPVGPGRGSAAGSLVAYSLEITEIDPIKYNLIFERFLNPDRVSMPDIDVDFCKDRRNEVINYVAERYGKDQVAQIITFGTMAARAVIRDVGRALNIPYKEVDDIAKMIPGGPNIKIEKALQQEPKLKEAYESNTVVKELIDIARRLEGLSRHASTHAAGVVISPSPLTDYTPLYKNPSEDTITTQFDMKSIEAIGLLKFDFLGLKTLTVIEETLRYLKEQGKEIDFKKIHLDDKKTFELLSSGHTTGVFQLESSGMREILVKMQPNRFEDLIALVALYRPGPLGSGMVDTFIKRKKGIEKVEYELPHLKEILDETYGVILYQEQVMRIANKVAGFSMGQADELRKAMGKKIREKMAQMEEAFIKGAVKNGVNEAKAKALFEKMSFFAEYGFNKSHSAAYAYLAYQTAYLKAHFPVEFMAANLSQEENTDKIVHFINECRAMNIKVLPPDINLSGSRFRVVGGAIRFGLDAVKGVGASAVQQILMAREDGPFESLEDFVSRVDSRKVNRKVMESLVKAGAFDDITLKEIRKSQSSEEVPPTLLRAYAMEKMDSLLKRRSSLSLFNQGSMFTDNSNTLEIKQWTEDELLNAEKDALGFFVTGHPINRFKGYLRALGVGKITTLDNSIDGSDIAIAGIITGLKKMVTKTKSETMAICTVEDEEGIIECIAFPEVYRENSDILSKNNLVFIKGTVDKSEKGTKILIKEVNNIEDVLISRPYRVELTIEKSFVKDDNLKKVKDTLESFKGESPVYIKLDLNGWQTLMITEYNVTPHMELIDELNSMLGYNSVSLLPINGDNEI